MTRHISFTQMSLLVGGAVVGAAVLIGIIYALHRGIRASLKQDTLKPPRVREENETAFTLAAMQAVIAQVRSEQKSTAEKLLGAERRVDELARRFEAIVREMDQALLIFGRDGFVSAANPRVRELLGPDSWSHRRYPETLAVVPKVAEWVGACLESGSETRKETTEIDTPDKGRRSLLVSVLPLHDKSGSVDAAVCLLRLLREGPPPPVVKN